MVLEVQGQVINTLSFSALCLVTLAGAEVAFCLAEMLRHAIDNIIWSKT